MTHHTVRWHEPGVGPYLVCSCGRWRGDPADHIREQRRLHKEHCENESAGTAAAVERSR